MPQWTAQADLTLSSLPNIGGAGTQAFIPSNAVNTYVQGICLGYVAVDSQTLPSFQTVQPLAAGTTTPNFAGVVRAGWTGFDNAGALNASYISNATYTNAQGTAYIRATVKGLEYVWVDQSGSGAVTITNGIQLVSSRTTAGYGQGVALATATARSALIGSANLPASGIGSSLTAAALAQASVTMTVAGTPAAGDVLTVTLQIPYNDNNPGTVQTHAISVTLNSTTAVSATTAATALTAALNADPYFAVTTIHGVAPGGTWPYFLATSSAGVVTITVNTQANPFLVTGGTTSSAGTSLEQWRYYTFISGMVGNSLTSTAAVSGGAGSTLTAGGATFSSGTGYKGKVTALIYGIY
jgi:hypothetical protein